MKNKYSYQSSQKYIHLLAYYLILLIKKKIDSNELYNEYEIKYDLFEKNDLIIVEK